jgi:hypothetical protein
MTHFPNTITRKQIEKLRARAVSHACTYSPPARVQQVDAHLLREVCEWLLYYTKDKKELDNRCRDRKIKRRKK